MHSIWLPQIVAGSRGAHCTGAGPGSGV